MEPYRLRSEHRSALTSYLRREPGFNLFMLANLYFLGIDYEQINYWAMGPLTDLQGLAMLVERRAAFYATDLSCMPLLVAKAQEQQMNFTMGRRDIVEAVLAHVPPNLIKDVEAHYFCQLSSAAFLNDYLAHALPHQHGQVKQVQIEDVNQIGPLYTGSPGYEGLKSDQLRMILLSRLSDLRTFFVEVEGEAVSVASTSAETSESGMVASVWTPEIYRNHGYATAATAAVCRSLLAEGRTPYLFYRQGNEAAARIYAKLGFTIIGEWLIAQFLDAATS